MRVLVAETGIPWAIADVGAGLRDGLKAAGVEVTTCRLDAIGATPVDAVVCVSAIHVTADVIHQLRRVGQRVYIVFTESPYDHAHEIAMAAHVDGGWTHERAVVPAFQSVNPHVGYLPHAWHTERHAPAAADSGVPAHDVVLVGSGFPERITFLNAIDWTGINLGLYGIWEGFGLKESLEPCIKSGPVDNATAVSLYRRAKIGLNLYRRTTHPVESLNPRAYELAACGTFSISEHREESAERFGWLVPTFRTAAEASRLIREWLCRYDDREMVKRQLPGRVADSTWNIRAAQVVADMARWCEVAA